MSLLSIIVYTADRSDSYVFSKILTPAGVEPARVSSVPLTEAILELVKAGLGVSVLARWAIEPALKSGAARGVRITRRGVFRTWTAATLKGRAGLAARVHHAARPPSATGAGSQGSGFRLAACG